MKEAKFGARFVAVLLMAGGMLGVLGSVITVYRLLPRGQLSGNVSAALSNALFVWCISTGVALWRRTPAGFKWAKLLFALQIPVFTIARFAYEFSTFFSFRMMIGNTTHNCGGNIGSSANLNLLPESVAPLLGDPHPPVLDPRIPIRIAAKGCLTAP